MFEIIDGLYLASVLQLDAVKNISEYYIINCTKDLPMASHGMRVPVDDDGSIDSINCMYGSFNVCNTCNTCNTAINKELENGGKVIVHCKQGQQRSATIVCAFLVWKGVANSLQEAIQIIKTKKPDAFFWQVNFKAALERYWKTLMDLRLSIQDAAK